MTSKLLMQPELAESSCPIAIESAPQNSSLGRLSDGRLSDGRLSDVCLSNVRLSNVHLPETELSHATTEAADKVEVSSLNDRVIQLTRSHYKADHQIEFMHLTAEVDALLQQVQMMKQQRLTV